MLAPNNALALDVSDGNIARTSMPRFEWSTAGGWFTGCRAASLARFARLPGDDVVIVLAPGVLPRSAEQPGGNRKELASR
jgi:hypothetical protein